VSLFWSLLVKFVLAQSFSLKILTPAASQENGILYFLVNGTQCSGLHQVNHKELGSCLRISIVFDCLRLAHFSVALAKFILCKHFQSEVFFEECIARLLNAVDVVKQLVFSFLF
jgi:hypothetical protein